MLLFDGDILRLVQFATLSTGETRRNKFYFVLQGVGSVESAEVLASLESWIEDAYTIIRTRVHTDTHLGDGTLDSIAWLSAAWRISAHVGDIHPSDTFNGTLDTLPAQVGVHANFKTTRPRTRRPFYYWQVRESDEFAGELRGAPLAQFVTFFAALLEPVSLPSGGYLRPCVVSAAGELVAYLTEVTVHGICRAMARRRLTA